MNMINPNKLHHSKWTAVEPLNKEKHFIVTKLLRDEEENVVDVVIEAIHSHRETTLPWQELKNPSAWKIGWK
ncbi:MULTISPECIES: TIGR02450 family Trp-rich protein [Vreelandella]|uniref:TIGR02450 family Trp-rich protein n=2 Tax=Vreelandella TaxID=3137766 RepID=A0A7C9P461_9GAMM|nr:MULTISPECIES: TIGR02450 family Trp-rich protein [Halomonas]NDL72190.1 TIGR02450 family Trp-rich protein [Halomonas alkaliphila]NYS45011.1 TIGR02450 family Trp-rich protein [Halomonas zhaodongensis]